MLFTAVSCVVFAIPADAGRVEVEGLVISAEARVSPFGGVRPGAGGEVELDLSVTSKTGGAAPIVQFDGPIRVVGADNRSLASPSRFGLGVMRGSAPNRWTVRLEFEAAPPKTLPFVEGSLSIAPAEWRKAKFEGASLKPNAVVKIEGGSAKLTVLDLDDPQPAIQFRVTLPGPLPENPRGGGGGIAARATLVDVSGKNIALSPRGGGYGGSDAKVDHRFRFDVEKPIEKGSLRTLTLEVPAPKGPSKKISFRIPNVPVEETRPKARAGR